MKLFKKFFTGVMCAVVVAVSAVSVYAYRADYVSGNIGNGASASGGLYMSTGNSYSASADTRISANGYEHKISVNVSITPYSSTEATPPSASNSSNKMNYVEVNAGPVTVSNASKASGSHSATIYPNGIGGTLTYTWSDNTNWSKG